MGCSCVHPIFSGQTIVPHDMRRTCRDLARALKTALLVLRCPQGVDCAVVGLVDLAVSCAIDQCLADPMVRTGHVEASHFRPYLAYCHLDLLQDPSPGSSSGAMEPMAAAVPGA